MDEEVGKVATREGKGVSEKLFKCFKQRLPKEIGNDSESIDHIPGEE